VSAPPAAPARAALRYYGGKARLAPWIVAHLPPHAAYVEPFGGAASVLLRKAPAPCEVYNDLDGEIVGFFRVLRERPDDLAEAIRHTPFARRELDAACAPTPPDLDALQAGGAVRDDCLVDILAAVRHRPARGAGASTVVSVVPLGALPAARRAMDRRGTAASGALRPPHTTKEHEDAR
jgi:hypothetical protein